MLLQWRTISRLASISRDLQPRQCGPCSDPDLVLSFNASQYPIIWLRLCYMTYRNQLLLFWDHMKNMIFFFNLKDAVKTKTSNSRLFCKRPLVPKAMVLCLEISCVSCSRTWSPEKLKTPSDTEALDNYICSILGRALYPYTLHLAHVLSGKVRPDLINLSETVS